MSQQTQQPRAADIGTIAIDADITLRRMVVHPAESKGTVLLLHGFPESLHAWKGITPALACDYEVHAFDWPGFGRSSRPSVDRFSYSPRAYAQVLKGYIDRAGIDQSTLSIYATDISALPTLLLALAEPTIAKSLTVGDFAPFDRPAYMWENLQALKSKPASDQVRAFMNANREEILANTFFRGLPEGARYEVPREFKDDIARSWDHDGMTSVDAFYHYYSNFTQDQKYFEANLARLSTPVTVVWGGEDLYIKKEMGIELANRIKADLKILPGVGHYPHLQAQNQTIEEIRASFR
ncbi:alpha/beta hydrolase [Rhizobium calliandrae]|uniref:Alpha/beta hydrolase n=1 Tax=Rhizobium calliandrae TaxID=1312182 RepID=A0ABT7KR34_9HYPH|nr:alpha/beta hydrolase [Rhizobium calliandrae]MDL2410450.1 alpha/beta hydrolase [Rhizobium calliandrae]